MPPTAFRQLQRKLRKFFKTVHFTVFAISMTLIVLFVLFGVLFAPQAQATFGFLHETITKYMGWYYMLVVTFFVVFALWLMFSRYGNIRLGGRHEKPEFSFLAWFSMLFSAGMGIGLIFYSVAEPAWYFADPPKGDARTAEAANTAMTFTFFHWGLHAWAIYVIMALTLAYFAFRFRLPFTIRSIFYPIFGDRIYGPIGHTIDVLAILATLFGLATSLGLGVMQLNTGLDRLGVMSESTMNQVILIAVITAIAVGSVVSGLHRGLKWFSIFNLTVAVLLILFIFVVGPTLFNLRFLVDSVGNYLQSLIHLSFWNDAVGSSPYEGEWGDDVPASAFQRDWTVFYWAWWIAWSPFVGIFIARVSRGRTIREFVAGSLLMPAVFVFIWLAIFGGTALNLELEAGEKGAGIADAELTAALFEMLEHLPLTTIMSIIACILITTYFITSSDSATYVVDALITRGSKRSPTRQRVIWGITEGGIAAVLLVAGAAYVEQEVNNNNQAGGNNEVMLAEAEAEADPPALPGIEEATQEGDNADEEPNDEEQEEEEEPPDPLTALQTGALTTGLPFSIILLAICYCFRRALRREFDVEGVEWWDEYA